MRTIEVYDAGSVVAVVADGGVVPFEHRAYRGPEASRGGIDNTVGAEVEVNVDEDGERYLRFLADGMEKSSR